jgi:o-succinylbenzoate synthase
MLANIRVATINTLLKFKKPATTSRGSYSSREVWHIIISSTKNHARIGVGECAPLPGLSSDLTPDYTKILSRFCRMAEETGRIDCEALRPYPSILFGMETAFRHFEQENYALWDTPFSRGEAGIPINGLVWMDDCLGMFAQIEKKIEAGFRCIKLKIGAINFDDELLLLKHIRAAFPSKEMEIRVDANGAFSPENVMEKLNRLAEFDIHSIEQPLQKDRWESMSRLASTSPIPIALDEELIGHHSVEAKITLLRSIRPQYIVLKPSLHGGIHGCEEWISIAEKENISWWITSALESNIGLNAIAQWCATRENTLHQGLGTGALYTDNIPIPIETRGDRLWYTPLDKNHIPYPIHLIDGKAGIRTSGSTGIPKEIKIPVENMINSAAMTCTYLGLKPGAVALLCMPGQYIGSIMMIVRTLFAGLNLIVREASGHPLRSEIAADIDFAAMTPLQVYNSLAEEVERDRLRHVKCLIIGGGSIDKTIEDELRTFPHPVYSTYGMTETISHIALRRINAPEADDYYTILPDTEISLSSDSTLVIDAPKLSDRAIYTNDVAEILPDGRFRIIGRRDNIINTGGIKIQAESVEEKLRSVLLHPFAISSAPDPKFGEAIVLIVESDIDISDINTQIPLILTKYERPRHIIPVPRLPRTGNGKIDRGECKKIAAGWTGFRDFQSLDKKN